MGGPINKRFDTEEKYVASIPRDILVYAAYVGSKKKADNRFVCTDKNKLLAAIKGLELTIPEIQMEHRPGTIPNAYDDVIVEDFLERDPELDKTPRENIRFINPVVNIINDGGVERTVTVWTAVE